MLCWQFQALPQVLHTSVPHFCTQTVIGQWVWFGKTQCDVAVRKTTWRAIKTCAGRADKQYAGIWGALPLLHQGPLPNSSPSPYPVSCLPEISKITTFPSRPNDSLQSTREESCQLACYNTSCSSYLLLHNKPPLFIISGLTGLSQAILFYVPPTRVTHLAAFS